MADSASESDSGSVDGLCTIPFSMTREQFQKRIESLQQENKVLKLEVETYKFRIKSLQEENKYLRQVSVNIQAKAEQEEEYISNTLLKKIQALKKEQEALAINYEQEEECLTNDLFRKLSQLRQEKVHLEQTLEHEQEALVNKLMRKIEKLEAQTQAKQHNLEQLRREKVELENTLEQEQEALVNKLWKRMDKLEAEKRMLQEKLEQPVSAPPSPRDINKGDTAANLTLHVQHLRSEVAKLKMQLLNAQQEHSEKMALFVMEEKNVRDENVRLQKRLQMEVERREALCRHLSESESSLEMDEERQFNEGSNFGCVNRSVPSPVPMNSSAVSSNPNSPAMSVSSREAFSPNPHRCHHCNQSLTQLNIMPSPSPPPPVFSPGSSAGTTRGKSPSQERFLKPAAPPPP
ncbi:coiled-coil domain-containing protein 6-like [Uloborus diversus]|uniref:coiled-coil domain-containing protein 6-like n=1 Tax=Uloborus diversus TaxID=327109 RepID=UPI00240A5769|nr:coiled-coil domain-containing protein 6-like [Uloborus diversus]